MRTRSQSVMTVRQPRRAPFVTTEQAGGCLEPMSSIVGMTEKRT